MNKQNTNQQQGALEMKDRHILGCISKRIASKSGKGLFPCTPAF